MRTGMSASYAGENAIEGLHMATNGTDNGQREQVIALLAQAHAAHQQYEGVILHHGDPHWADWLAGFVLDRSLEKLLAHNLSEAQLAQLFKQWDEDYAAAGAGVPRAEYFAGRLLGTNGVTAG